MRLPPRIPRYKACPARRTGFGPPCSNHTATNIVPRESIIFAALILLQFDGSNPLVQLLPFAAVFAIFYFLLILPTQKRRKKQKEMLDNLKSGDRVVTTGGLRGTIVSLKDDTLHIRVPPQDVRLEIVRSAVASVEEPKE